MRIYPLQPRTASLPRARAARGGGRADGSHHPNDRRQQDRPVLFDMRSHRERRRRDRRQDGSAGRRGPQPPLGIDTWA